MGGTDYVFSSLLPYLYTNPMATLMSEILATTDNIAIFEERLADKDLNKDVRNNISNVVGLMKTNLSKYVNPAGKDTVYATIDTIIDHMAAM